MKPLIIILITSIVYALIRAKHDSYIAGGPWKVWAFIEGALIALSVVSLSLMAFGLSWWMGFPLGGIFAFTFWLVFDCLIGWHFAGSILYIGNAGFDKKMREIFKYNYSVFGWESGALFLILFKCVWLFILIGGYFALL
jgi:hypothetical protein